MFLKNATFWLIVLSIAIALIINSLVFGHVLENTWSFLFLFLICGAILLVIKDLSQKDEPVEHNFPLVYWIRKLSIMVGPMLRQYWFANDLDERPYNRETRNWVYQTARKERNTIGFGSRTNMDQIGSVLVLPRTFTNAASQHGEDVEVGYERTLGAHSGISNPLTLKRFVNISAMSYGSLSYRAIAALNLGAKKAGILHNTGEGGLAPAHQQGGSLIYQIGTAKYGMRNQDGRPDWQLLKKLVSKDTVKAVEIKLAQGAKPGKGGMLLKEKITREIAEIRKIPMGKDAYAPPRHEEFNDVDGLFDFIDKVRNTADKPVGIKMVIGHSEEIEAIAEKMAREPGRGPDFITIDGGDGGTGASPLVLSSYAGLPLKQAIAVVDWALKHTGVRDRVVLFASGRIATPIDVVVAMALGADAVNIARGFLLSLGCIQALQCHTNHCPTGIATQNKFLQRGLDVEAASDRVANFANQLQHEVFMLSNSCGYTSPTQFTADDIMIVTSPGHLDYLSELQGISAWEASQERKEAIKAGKTVGQWKIDEASRAHQTSA